MQSSNGRPRGGGGEGDSENTAEHQEGQGPVPSPGNVGYDDPWYDALASGWGEPEDTGASTAPLPAQRGEHEGGPAAGTAEVYLEVQRSAAFQEVRSRYRRFIIPATVAFSPSVWPRL